MLNFTAVNKTYNKGRKSVQALRDVSFSIDKGEVFGFVGPNGAGKSTTIKIMLNIISNYEGEVSINGTNARNPEARMGVSYLPESPALYDQFTPLEVLQMSLRMFNVKHKNSTDLCMTWLERFSVAKNAHRKIRHLSKGNVQRVALAHALVSEPNLLVLDEPLSGLDPVGRKDVINILNEYKQNGGAIFFTSHVLHDVERIADRFGFINEGRLLTTRSPQELMEEHADRFIIRYQSSQLSEGTRLRTNEFELNLNQDELPNWLTKLNQQGGRLVNISPQVSLEKVFFGILEKNHQKT